MTSDGLTLSVSEDANLKILGDQNTVNKWMDTIKENKLAILAELEPLQDLHPCKPCTPLEACNVSVTLPHDANAMRTHSGKYSITVTDSSTDPVVVDVTIAGQATFSLEIPQKYYDGLALLELMEQYNAQAETHSVMPGLSKETEGIDSRRAA